MSDLIFGDLVSGDVVCAWTANVDAKAKKKRSLMILIIGYLTVRILVQGEEKENVYRPRLFTLDGRTVALDCYRNGQNSGTRHGLQCTCLDRALQILWPLKTNILILSADEPSGETSQV